ncbi:MAG: diaminopimelate epimerase [Acidimicrobiales bacterium]|nr:diaminopimelate epimerase [Acidimicrobiales bacterium]
MTSFQLDEPLRLTKHHGLGNDFLIALVDGLPLGAPMLAQRLCDRATGVGADGLILGIERPADDGAIRYAFRLFNSDGSPAEVSGNGLRCFGQAVAMHRGADELTVIAETPVGDRRIVVSSAGSATVVQASVEMGAVHDGIAVPDDLLELVGAAGGSTAAIAPGSWATGDIGNPHIVFPVDDPGAIDLPTFGAAVESVLGGINVHVIAPTGPNAISLRVWERGAGITRACGSGASVAAKLAVDQDLVSAPVEVVMPGGSATVALEADGVVLTGPAEFVAIIEVPNG